MAKVMPGTWMLTKSTSPARSKQAPANSAAQYQSGSTRFGEPVSKAGLAVEVASVLAIAAAYHNDRVGALLGRSQDRSHDAPERRERLMQAGRVDPTRMHHV